MGMMELAGEIADGVVLNYCMPREQPAQHVPATTPQVAVRESRLVSVSGMLVTEAPLQVDEIQNLSDQIADLMKAAVGLNLPFHLRIELGPASQVSDETIARVNELLYEVSDKLRLQRE